MNLVKFKDILVDEKFNIYFKNKYAILCNMKYAVPLNISSVDYNKIERGEAQLSDFNYSYIDIDSYNNYIDAVETEKINNINKYIYKNNHSTDQTLTLEQLKIFRAWLATELLSLSDYNDDVKNMLEYYKSNMYDEVVKCLSLYPKNISLYNITSSCGCNTSISSQLESISSCDPISVYRNSIYNCMVYNFSRIDFWNEFPIEFFKLFKLYIDNILNIGLYLGNSKYPMELKSCECTDLDSHKINEQYLLNLQQSLEYIINDDISGHKMFIATSFANWAKYVYELMSW